MKSSPSRGGHIFPARYLRATTTSATITSQFNGNANYRSDFCILGNGRLVACLRTDNPAEGFETAPHRSPMLSLDNAMDEDEMRAFDARIRRMLASDGVASSLDSRPHAISGGD